MEGLTEDSEESHVSQMEEPEKDFELFSRAGRVGCERVGGAMRGFQNAPYTGGLEEPAEEYELSAGELCESHEGRQPVEASVFLRKSQ